MPPDIVNFSTDLVFILQKIACKISFLHVQKFTNKVSKNKSEFIKIFCTINKLSFYLECLGVLITAVPIHVVNLILNCNSFAILNCNSFAI